MKNMNQTLKCLLIGIIISMVVVSIIGLLITDNKLSFVLGEVLGSVIAIMLAFHMNATVYRAVEMGEEGAQKYTKRMAFLRFVIMGCAVVVALTFPKVFNIFGTLLGIMGLKVSAYLQPLTNRFL